MATNQFLVDQAKMLYLQYCEPLEIAKRLDLPVEKIRDYVHKGQGWDRTPWKELRLAQTREILREVKEGSRVRVANIFKLGLPLIEKALKERIKSDKPLTIKEAKEVTDILFSFDKIERLEENKPTEIVEAQKNVSLEELRRVVLSDPFVDINLIKGEGYDRRDQPAIDDESAGKNRETGITTQTAGDPLSEAGS